MAYQSEGGFGPLIAEKIYCVCNEVLIEHQSDGLLHKETMSKWCRLFPDHWDHQYKNHRIQKAEPRAKKWRKKYGFEE
jgi:hypothetical protein